MESILYSNGDICRYETLDGSCELALIFSSFVNDGDDTILAIPLNTSVPKASIPFLVGGTLMYIAYCDMFRIKHDMLISAIGHIDSVGIEMIGQSVFSAFKGSLPNISIPTAVLHDDEKAAYTADEKSSTVIETEPARKLKYTREDYDIIVNNYQTNMSMLLRKYGLKDKQALYKLKHNLQQRYGKAPAGKENDNDSPMEDELDGE